MLGAEGTTNGITDTGLTQIEAVYEKAGLSTPMQRNRFRVLRPGARAGVTFNVVISNTSQPFGR